MDATNNIANDLFYKVRSRFSGLKLGDATGTITINPEDARFFDFDYMEDGNAIGHISISLAEPNSMKVYFSTGITENMDDGEKRNWYTFLRELRSFAKRRLMAFDTRDIAKDNLDQRDFAFLSQNAKPKQEQPNMIQKPVGESIMSESTLYGSRTMSYQKLMDTRLIIKHSKAVMDDMQPGARTRNISALFVENQDGERFKYPFIHLAGARAMQRHVANGGLPYDDIGKSLIKMSEEIAQLKSFSNYVVRNDLMNSDTNNIVERSTEALNRLREQISKLSRQGYYEEYKANFQLQPEIDVPEEVVEDFTEKFTVRNFKEDIKSVFPVLYRLTKEDNTIGYDDIVAMTQEDFSNEDVEIQAEDNPFERFESWIMALGEESAITSQDEEEKSQAVKELQALVGEHFPAGVDGTNAIESLKGIIEDPQLFKQIKDQAKEDPDGCVRPLVKAWLEDNAPEVVDQLDFGDMVDEPAADQGGDQTAPEEEPQMAGDDPDERNKKDDLPFDADPEDKPPSAKAGKYGLGPSTAKHLAKQGMRQVMDVKELAEFINSFYDRNTGTFPKGPEGVCTMVGKKFGEQAEQVARKFVERMAPHQEQGAEELAELGRMRELAGVKSEESQVSEGMRLSDEVGLALKAKGVKYSPEKEDEIIGMAVEVMKEMGIDKKTIRGYISYDEDFVPEMLDMLDREPDDGPKEPKHPQARDYAEEDSVSDQEGPEDLLAAIDDEMKNPGKTIDNLQDVLNGTFDSMDSPEFEKARAIINRYLDFVTNTDIDHYDDEEDPDHEDEPMIRRMRHGNIQKHIRDYDLTDYLAAAYAELDKLVKQPKESLELERIKQLSGIAQGLGL